MREDEVQRVTQELDTALAVLQSNRADGFDDQDARIQTSIAEIRRELAMYRAIVEMRAKLNSSRNSDEVNSPEASR